MVAQTFRPFQHRAISEFMAKLDYILSSRTANIIMEGRRMGGKKREKKERLPQKQTKAGPKSR